MTHMFEMCEAAIARGLTSVCFTEHVEFDPADFGYGFFDYDRYRAGIQEARARYGHILRIGMGAEVSFTSKKVDEIRDFLANHEFDFVLGSLHMIDELFIGGDEYFEGRTEEEVYAPYWAELAAMASSGLFKRIGHLDYLKQAHPPTWGPFSFEHWQDHIARALEAILASGATIEVNTSGIRGLRRAVSVVGDNRALQGLRASASPWAPTPTAHGTWQATSTSLGPGSSRWALQYWAPKHSAPGSISSRTSVSSTRPPRAPRPPRPGWPSAYPERSPTIPPPAPASAHPRGQRTAQS